MSQNSLKKMRESIMLSRAELARKANILPFTIARIENGKPCRLETKRKIILALGFKISDENEVFGDDRESSIKDNGGRRSSVDRHPEQRSDKERKSELDRRQKPRAAK